MIRRFFREYLKPASSSIGLVFLCSLVVAFITALPAGIMKYVIDDVLFQKDTRTLTIISVGLVVVFLIKGVFYFAQHYLVAQVGQKVLRELRKRIFVHLQFLPISYYEDRNTGQIMSRITSDILVLQNVISSSMSLVADFLTIIGLISWILWLHFQLALISFIVLPIIGYAITLFSRRLRRLARDLQGKIGDLTSVLQENISGIRTVKANTAEADQIRWFEEENGENYRINMKNFQTMAMILPVVEFLNTTGLVVVLGYGGWLVINAKDASFTPGDLISFLTALGMLMTPVKKLTNANNYFQQMTAALERIYEILDEPREDSNALDLPELPPIEGNVEFKEVSFFYPQTESGVRGVSFSVEPGHSVAFVGPSGGGKTTVVNLLQRLYPIQGGEICIDGKEIHQFNIASLRRQIGVVPQDPVLFSWSVEDNIRFGSEDVSQEDIVAAAKMANAHEFIITLPRGYETLIGEHGVKLSGGQRQRIAIARAIVRSPRILILDEATSALDTESEVLVRDALEKVMQGRTTFIIAHRLSTIRNCDEILVVQDGVIVQSGDHESLLAVDGLYRTLYLTGSNEDSDLQENIELSLVEVGNVAGKEFIQLKESD